MGARPRNRSRPGYPARLLGPDSVLAEYVVYFNRARPHQGIDQRTPLPAEATAVSRLREPKRVTAIPVLGGLHHAYRLAA
jgi:putative transposase